MPKKGDITKRSIILCSFCKKEFEIRDCYLRRNQIHCCSRSCLISYRNASPTDKLGKQVRTGRPRVNPKRVKLTDRIIERHGHATGGKTSITYQSWRAMNQRCNCSKNKDYHNYGGRGIQVTPEWKSFVSFLNNMGERPSKEYSLDRIDPDGNYTPFNCQWILKTENSRKGNAERSRIKGGYLLC